MKLEAKHLSLKLCELAARQLPRWLTQACRDPNDPAYGCFDRNWWHYRIRDFASIILQQGAYALHLMAHLPQSAEVIPPDTADGIVAGACRFWNARAMRHGAFEEYYPWEQGYPPVAFSTLAVAKLVAAGVVRREDVNGGLRVAAKQLASRFEAKAANQQIAGLAALAWVRKVAPELVAEEIFEALVQRSLALQTSEGWYWEYDGPDIGYLSVTVDCLWDLWDATHDERFKVSAYRALRFIFQTVKITRHGVGMLNARNTDYVVPYGVARCMAEGNSEQRTEAAIVLHCFYKGLDSSRHFLHAVDDRYWCHYIGHSIVRATQLLDTLADVEFPCKVAPSEAFQYCEESGYIFASLRAGASIAVATKKGGSFCLWQEDGRSVANYGWLVKMGKKQHVTHWWSDKWTCRVDAKTATIEGSLVPCKNFDSTPWMHMALRVFSFCLGRALIEKIKGILIFRKPSSPIKFKRVIELEADSLLVTDTLDTRACAAPVEVVRAPRASKRHVASADSYHVEDAALNRGVEKQEDITQTPTEFTATTRWKL